jgi:4-amino-4-deoxy-L-arabinose transferase-like glycosyltransferase
MPRVRERVSLALQSARRPRSLAAFTAVALVALVVAVALTRFVDGDEGFYALAGVLVVDGNVLYEDFFYTQMPLLPYVFGAWFWSFGENWYVLRALAAVLTLATAFVLYAHVRRWARNPGWALLAVGLFGLSSLVLGWFTVAKTYAFSTGLLLAGYALIAPPQRGQRRATWLACGLLLGLAISTRLLFVAAALPLLAAAGRGNIRHAFRSRVAPLVAGVVVGLAPSFAYFAVAPKPFVFDNLAFHSIRSSGGLVGNFEQKLQTVLDLLGDVQFLTLLIAAATFATLGRRRGYPVSFAFWIALALGLASLLPTPTWTQYFCVTVPFLIAGCLETAPALTANPFGTGLAREGAVVILSLAAGLYVALAGVGIYRYVAWGQGVPGVERSGPAESWKIAEIRRVSAAIDEHAEPGEEVLALWEGYIFGTHAKVVPGLEIRSSLVAAAHISPESEARYRVISVTGVARMLRQHRTRLFVLGHHTKAVARTSWERIATSSGYRRTASFHGTRVYLWEGGR